MSAHLERMNIVITGHVDHGKSTLVGRLLADTGSLPQGKLESVRESCAKNARPFEYSMLLDALEDEQKQGITIDSARIFFKSQAREYVIIDAPGHIEFLRNMLSGASRAVAAVLVIDAIEGVAENSKRHGLLLSLLGISQVVVVINKLDALGYDKNAFLAIQAEYEAYLKTLGITPKAFVPISAREGKNLIQKAPEMAWYQGESVLEVLDGFKNAPREDHSFFAMPLQDVYRFSNENDDRRIYAGTIASGSIGVGEKIRFLPSGKEAHLKSIETWSAPLKESAKADEAVGFTLQEEIYVKNGEVLTKAQERTPIKSVQRLKANLIWLGKNPLQAGREYLFKLGSAKVKASLERIERILDEESQESLQNEALYRHQSGQVILRLSHPIALTAFRENPTLGRFVIVDGFDAAGGGIVLEGLEESSQSPQVNDFEEELFALLQKYFPHRFTLTPSPITQGEKA